jgi:uncharacterized protein (TIGR02453 family)
MYPFQNAVDFLNELSQNNNRDWFEQHRLQYLEVKTDFEKLISELLVEIADFDETLRFLSVKDCVFRINRDVRFTKNKQPYKTNLGASFIHFGKNGSNPGYYLQIEPSGKIMIGGGWYILDSKQISQVRKAIVKNSTELRNILAEPKFVKLYTKLDNSNNLKTHPKGYSAQDENIDLLKQTNFVVFNYIILEKCNHEQLKKSIIEHFKTLHSLVDFLRRTA